MGARDLQQSILRVVACARAIDVRHYEWRERSSLQHELLPAISEALSDAINVFTQVLEYYNPTFEHNNNSRGVPNAACTDFAEDIEPVIEGGDGIQRITDLAFMARWELAGEREGFGSIRSTKETWGIISVCGRACSRLITSAMAIENAICAYEGLTSTLLHVYHSELDRSLRVRRAYALFRQTVLGTVSSAPENVRDKLRGGVIGIAQLLGSDIYRDLRSSDRMRIESLQSQLIEWLDANREGDPLTGIRLWQEIKNFSELFLEVNQRADLREHDQAVVAVVYNKLFRTDNAPDVLPPDLELRLQSLFGRDEELDRLIANQGSHRTEDWRRPLEMLLESLDLNRPEMDGP